MKSQYRLVGLKNSELLAELSELVCRSNELTANVLAHLAELEERLLHLELGFSSPFAYCVQALGMSEGSAGRRIAAARVCRRFPEAFELIAKNDLHLSALCELGPHLNPENASELFETCRRKTRRQVEALLAARFPKPGVREQIRRLPVRATRTETSEPSFGETVTSIMVLSADAATNAQQRSQTSVPARCPGEEASKEAMIESVRASDTAHDAGSGARAGVATPAPVTAAPRRREIEPLSEDRFGVHFTADSELRELIERARVISSHRLPKGDLASLMKLVLMAFVEQEEKRRFAVGRKPRQVGTQSTPPGGASPERERPRDASSFSPPPRSRHVPAAVRREVYLRDQGQCSFVSEDGRRCEARAFLEFDHIEPWAALGATVADNIRLRCRSHNLLHARNCFGEQHIVAKIAAQRRQGRTASNSVAGAPAAEVAPPLAPTSTHELSDDPLVQAHALTLRFVAQPPMQRHRQAQAQVTGKAPLVRRDRLTVPLRAVDE